MNSTGNALTTGGTIVKQVEITNPSSITDDLAYTLRKSAVPCRQLRMTRSVDGKTTCVPGDSAVISLPIRQNTYLNQGLSYLMFTVYNPAGAVATIDHTVMTMISSLSVSSGNQVLETVGMFNVLSSMLIDTTCDPDCVQSHAIDWGTSASSFSVVNGANLADATTVNSTVRKGSTIAADSYRTFAIPLIGLGSIGLGASKYFPLQLQNNLQLNITFNTTARCTKEGNRNLQFSNIYYQARCIELGNFGENLVNQIAGGTRLLHSSSWKAYSSQVPVSTTGEQNLNFGVACSSLKTVLIGALINYNTTDAYSNSQRIKAWDSAQLMVAGTPVPQKAITSDQEQFAELMNAFDAYDSTQCNSCLTSAGYSQLYNGDNTNNTACNLFGLNLDVFSRKSELISGGLDVMGANTAVQFVFNKVTTGDALSPVIAMFANFDIVFIIDSTGEITVKY